MPFSRLLYWKHTGIYWLIFCVLIKISYYLVLRKFPMFCENLDCEKCPTASCACIAVIFHIINFFSKFLADFFSKIFKLYFSNYGLHPALSFYIWAWFNIGEFTTVSIIHPLVQMLIYSDLTWFLRRSSRLLTTNDHSKVLLDYFNP